MLVSVDIIDVLWNTKPDQVLGNLPKLQETECSQKVCLQKEASCTPENRIYLEGLFTEWDHRCGESVGRWPRMWEDWGCNRRFFGFGLFLYFRTGNVFSEATASSYLKVAGYWCDWEIYLVGQELCSNGEIICKDSLEKFCSVVLWRPFKELYCSLMIRGLICCIRPIKHTFS